MLLARNLLANIVNQGWNLLLNILVLPLYLSLVGSEAYALVGFGFNVQVWMTLIDAGMSATLARDTARYRSGEVEARELRTLVQTLDWMVLAALLLIAAAAVSTRGWWVGGWFQPGDLSPNLIETSMALVILFGGLRCAGTLYRSGLMGLERQVLANGISTAAVTLRLLAPIPLVAAHGDVRILFACWVLVALVELIGYRLALGVPLRARPFGGFAWAALAVRGRLAGGLALFSIVSVVVTQSDKLILARLLTMTDYGFFSLAVILSNGVLTLSLPIMQTLQPQLTMAASRGEGARQKALLRTMTALMMAVVLAPSLIVAAFPARLVAAWTGNIEAALAVQAYAGFYVLGSALAAPVAVAYALQLAHGRIRLHLSMNLLFGLVLIPAIWFVTNLAGARGAALVWLSLNMILLIGYCPFVIRRFLPEALGAWMAEVLRPGLAMGFIVLGARLMLGDQPGARVGDMLLCVMLGCACLLAAVTSSELRPLAATFVRMSVQKARRRD